MVYMVIASIACAVQAGHQGGAANSAMLLSILVSYGRECFIFIFLQLYDLVLTPLMQCMLLAVCLPSTPGI